MATEQEREAVARELHDAYWRNLAADSKHLKGRSVQVQEAWLDAADAAIALRDKALKDAAERVRGLKKKHTAFCLDTLGDGACSCGSDACWDINAAIEDAAREVERG